MWPLLVLGMAGKGGGTKIEEDNDEHSNLHPFTVIVALRTGPQVLPFHQGPPPREQKKGLQREDREASTAAPVYVVVSLFCFSVFFFYICFSMYFFFVFFFSIVFSFFFFCFPNSSGL